MRTTFLLLLAGCCILLSPGVLRANLGCVLTPPVQSGVGSNEVFFAAAITNTSLTTNLYLNVLQLSFTNAATNYLSADTNVFFANVPGVLRTNETYTDVVFGVAINPAAPPGNYSGMATVTGGTNVFATNILVSQTFQVLLPPAALCLAASRTNCILTWPSPPGNFVLQQCSDLTKTNWSTVTNATTVSNGWQKVTASLGSSNRFYRLAYP